MTITLTREEAQQILAALEQLEGWDTATQGDFVFDPSDEIEILCSKLKEKNT
jgi:molybdopterin-guanine dinucleotide biosynthesis protein A